MAIVRQQTPEQRELEKKRVELQALEVELTDRELELATLRAELAAFQETYLRLLGPRYAELDEIEAQIAEATAKLNPADAEAQAKAADARTHAGESARVAEESEHIATRSDFQGSETLRRLYRDVAKAMHPDLADDDEDRARRHSFMVRANEAYEADDEEKLRAILREWQSSPESVRGDGPGAELVRTIRKIARCDDRLQAISAAIDQLRRGDIAVMKTKVQEAKKQGRDLFAELVAQIADELARARDRLEGLKQGGGM